jgi:hypothetical protein
VGNGQLTTIERGAFNTKADTHVSKIVQKHWVRYLLC